VQSSSLIPQPDNGSACSKSPLHVGLHVGIVDALLLTEQELICEPIWCMYRCGSTSAFISQCIFSYTSNT